MIDRYVVPLLLLVVVLVFIGAFAYDQMHPCVRWERYDCTIMVCTYQVPSFDGAGQLIGFTCLFWEAQHETCRRCAERD